MRIRRVKMIMLLVIAALVLSSPVIYARPNDEGRQQLYKDLNLTAGQKKLLEENKNKHREQTKALYSQIREKMSLIREEVQKDEVNMEKVNQINNELKQLQAQILDDRLNSILEVRKILTPEQFKKFMGKMEKREDSFKNKWKEQKNRP